MKVLLAGINAKYIHSNPAIYSLRAYAMKKLSGQTKVEIKIAEYTINQSIEHIMQQIYKEEPDVLCISCYIWNITIVQNVITELVKLLPKLPIWLGGPEVSYDLVRQLQRFPMVTGIIYGEGEKTFYELVRSYAGFVKAGDFYKEIDGIAYQRADGTLIINQPSEPLALDELPFPYEDLQDFANRIIYYETSRGCPFSCSYCLSSIDKTLRFRSLEKVYEELSVFLQAKVKQVKFVDRTFNCNHSHAMSILQFIAEHDNGITNFHFEIAGDILTEEEIRLICSMRPGLIQLEIGVQSTNEKTLQAIHRKTDMNLLKKNVRRLLQNHNVHLHLDLIAGLPYEDISSFIHSFNEVYQMGGHELQLGFLKLLRGTPMMEMKKEQNIICTDFPPYEVLCTKYLSYGDVMRLKTVEEMLEIYHNSGQFRYTERFLLSGEGKLFASPFEFYDGLAAFYERKKYPVLCSARERRYEILLEYIKEVLEDSSYSKEFVLKTLTEYMTVDYYLRENAKARPGFAIEEKRSFEDAVKQQEPADRNITKSNYSDWKKAIYQRQAMCRGCDSKQLERQMHLEILKYAVVIPDQKLPQVVLFDYGNRSPVTKEANLVSAT